MDSLEHRESDQRQTTSNGEERVAAWQPPEDVAATVGHPQKINLHEVKSQPGNSDIFTSLRHSFVGRIYTDHLKQIPLIRNTVIAVWRTFYPLYVRSSVFLTSQQARRWRPIVKLQDYVSESRYPSIKVFDSERVETPPPTVFPSKDQDCLHNSRDYYDFPPVYVAQLSSASVYGGTNLVFFQDLVICHDLYDFDRDYTSEELHGRHVIDAKKKRMRLLKIDPAPEKIAEAAAFLDACATNYAHWLTEVLPRIAAFCSIERYADVAIIVDDGLHYNIIETLSHVVGSGRKIIMLPKGRSIDVASLYVTSVTGYVPFDVRGSVLVDRSHGKFSSFALDLVRKRFHTYMRIPLAPGLPKKIYVRRSSGVRNIANSEELERFLVLHGFFIIEPEKLTFIQQVDLFQSVETIIAPTGAALANAIFCRPGTRVAVLMSKHKRMIYRYWLNLLAPKNIELTYVLGSIRGNGQADIHADYYVDIKHLTEQIQAWKPQ